MDNILQQLTAEDYLAEHDPQHEDASRQQEIYPTPSSSLSLNASNSEDDTIAAMDVVPPTGANVLVEEPVGILKHEDEDDGEAAAATVKKKNDWHRRNVSWGENEIMPVNSNFAIAQQQSSNSQLPIQLSYQRQPSNGEDASTLISMSNNAAQASNIYLPETSTPSNTATSFDPVGFATRLPSTFRPRTVSQRGSSMASNANSSNKVITVEDVAYQSPMETEAETYIMQALEDRDPTLGGGGRRSRFDSDAASTLLSQIPDEATAHFMSAMPPPSSTAMLSVDGNNSRAQQSDSGATGTGGASGSNNNASSHRRLLQARQARHRRTQTTEQQLYGLTAAMDALHAQHFDVLDEHGEEYRDLVQDLPPPLTPSWHQRHHTIAVGPDVVGPSFHTLSQRNVTKKDSATAAAAAAKESSHHNSDDGAGSLAVSDVSSAVTTASTRWRKLRSVFAVTHHPKKTDDDDELDRSRNSTASPLPDVPESDEENGGMEMGNQKYSSRPESGMARQRRSTTDLRPGWSVFRALHDFLSPHKKAMLLYLKVFCCYFMVPLVGIAAILFYLGGNPPTGKYDDKIAAGTNHTAHNVFTKHPDSTSVASAAWWLLFVVRLGVTGTFAKFFELVIIDFLSIRSANTIHVLGPWLTLGILQSKGWPACAFLWSMINFGVLYGDGEFANHWLYWQDTVTLFTDANPGGSVVSSDWNRRVLLIAITVAPIVTLKRFWLGLYLGRQTFTHYSDKLANVMGKIVLITQVAALARAIERDAHNVQKRGSMKGTETGDRIEALINHCQDDTSVGGTTYNRSESVRADRIIDPLDRHPLTGSLSASQRMKIVQLLGAWEEPIAAEKKQERVSVSALLQFRRAMGYLKTPFPFSAAFGLADTRENCIESAQEIFQRLMLRSSDSESLQFEVLALTGVLRDGSLDQHKLKELIRIFRPDRDGSLSCLEFVKSVDVVYKDIRLLRATLANAGKIDRAFQSIFNVGFYIIVFTIILTQLGFDPLSIFLSISGVVLGVSFMIGSAAAKYFEGVLFILVRRPYAIGEGIVSSNVETESSYSGSPFWYVEDVTLFTTTVVYMYTGERATLSNGSLANSRIINSSRSPQAYMYILLKFPIDVTFEKLQVFHRALEEFLKNRPREWLSCLDFRATQVDGQFGFIEYMVAAQHRSNWADWGTIMLSKANLIHFSMELAKKLDISYTAPPMPINLSFVNGTNNAATGSNSMLPMPTAASPGSAANNELLRSLPDLSSLQAMFAPPRGGDGENSFR